MACSSSGDNLMLLSWIAWNGQCNRNGLEEGHVVFKISHNENDLHRQRRSFERVQGVFLLRREKVWEFALKQEKHKSLQWQRWCAKDWWACQKWKHQFKQNRKWILNQVKEKFWQEQEQEQEPRFKTASNNTSLNKWIFKKRSENLHLNAVCRSSWLTAQLEMQWNNRSLCLENWPSIFIQMCWKFSCFANWFMSSSNLVQKPNHSKFCSSSPCVHCIFQHELKLCLQKGEALRYRSQLQQHFKMRQLLMWPSKSSLKGSFKSPLCLLFFFFFFSFFLFSFHFSFFFDVECPREEERSALIEPFQSSLKSSLCLLSLPSFFLFFHLRSFLLFSVMLWVPALRAVGTLKIAMHQ